MGSYKGILDLSQKNFFELTYRGQVRRLRELAMAALPRFSISARKVSFINHGENATFRVEAIDGHKYLLRIHRGGYHTDEGIVEELQWLRRLSRDSTFRVPRPVPSLSGHLLENVAAGTGDARIERQCCLFHWIPGRFIEKSVSPWHLREIGELLARFHINSRRDKVKHRRYWSADGLIGDNPKVGSTANVPGLAKRHQRTLDRVRAKALRSLRRYEKKNRNRTGLIHADLHFGNCLVSNGKIAAIDFDDCGHGLFAYDLVVPLMSAQQRIIDQKGISKKLKDAKVAELKPALLEGYMKHLPWTRADEKAMADLFVARHLVGIGWMNSRSDNPRLRKYLKIAVRNAIRHIQSSGY